MRLARRYDALVVGRSDGKVVGYVRPIFTRLPTRSGRVETVSYRKRV